MLRRTSLLLLLTAGLVVGAVAPAFAGSVDDQTIADDAVLTEDDVFDYGLEESSPDEDLPPSVRACRRVRSVQRAANRRPNAISSFDDGGATQAESKVVVYPSERPAESVITAYSSSSAADCLEAVVDRALQDNLEPGSDYEFSGEPIEVPLGDESIVYQITATITSPDETITDLYVELGVIRVGRGIAFLQFTGVDAPFEGSEDLATIVVDALAGGLGDAEVGV